MTESQPTDLVQLIQEADFAIMEIEQARTAIDAAKIALELAKEDYEKARSHFDEVVAKADDFNIPRAKLKKLVEERAASLLASGLLSTPANQSRATKAAKVPKKAAKPKLEEAQDNDKVVVHLDA